jgi:hypothetical protein
MSFNAHVTPAYSNLIPELLLAFVGHTGGAFVETNAQIVSVKSSGTYSLVPEVDWVSLAERYDQDCRSKSISPLFLHSCHSHLSPLLTSGSNSTA